MNTLTRNLLVIGALFALGTIGSVMDRGKHSAMIGSAKAEPPGIPVTLVGPVPLPVSGTVSAQQGGVWNVALTGSPTLNLSSIQDHGRIAYQSTVNNSGPCTGTSCTFDFGFVPTGHRVVLEHITGLLSIAGPPQQILIQVTNGNVDTSTFLAPALGTSAFDNQIKGYMDAGQPIRVIVQPFPNPFQDPSFHAAQVITLEGYSLDCSAVTSCAPIAH